MAEPTPDASQASTRACASGVTLSRVQVGDGAGFGRVRAAGAAGAGLGTSPGLISLLSNLTVLCEGFVSGHTLDKNRSSPCVLQTVSRGLAPQAGTRARPT